VSVIIAIGAFVLWLLFRASTRSMNVFSMAGMVGLGLAFMAAFSGGSETIRHPWSGRMHSWDALEWWHYAIWAVMWGGPIMFFTQMARRQNGNMFSRGGMLRIASFFCAWFVLGLVCDPLFDGGCAPYNPMCYAIVQH
jgi:hypothetical protein